MDSNYYCKLRCTERCGEIHNPQVVMYPVVRNAELSVEYAKLRGSQVKKQPTCTYSLEVHVDEVNHYSTSECTSVTQ